MRNNPGHYVALVTLQVMEGDGSNNHKQVRLTRVKLLKPRDMLVLGQVYRLITSQEVTKALRHRENNDMFNHLHPPHYIPKTRPTDSQNTHYQGGTSTSTSTSSSSSTQRNRQNWQPSLQRIDEIGT